MAKSLVRCFDTDNQYINNVSCIGGRGEQFSLPGLSDEEEEEDINALNDETFGGDILEDWESSHEKLSKKDEEHSRRNVHFQDEDEWDSVSHIEDSINALVLDDEPLEDPAISYIARSKPVRVPNSRSIWRHSPVPPLHADASGSPQISSIWATSPSDSACFASKSLPENIRNGFSSAASLPKNLPNARTLEDIERDLLKGSPTDSNASLPLINFNQFSRPPPSFAVSSTPKGDGFRRSSLSSVTSPTSHYSHSSDGAHQLEGSRRGDIVRRLSSCEDEFAGLMSTAEKNWLISIQLNQLHTDDPYIDDYYYMAFMTKKLLNHSANGDQEAPLPIREPDRFKQLENRKYNPPQMENSLGRVQVVSVQAPRKIIDINIAAALKRREISKQKQTLLEIEEVYTTLLEIDDCSKRLAVASEGDELETVENESRAILQKLHKQMADEDKLVQFLQVRKGKRLLTRLEPFLDVLDRQRVAKSLMKGFGAISKKDGDDLLQGFAHLFEKAVSSTSLPQLVDIVSCVTTSCLIAALGHKMGVYLILVLLHHAESLDTNNVEAWNEFLEALSGAVSKCLLISKPLKPVCLQKTLDRHPTLSSQLIKLQKN